MPDPRVTFLLTAKDQATKTIKGLDRSFNQLKGTVGEVGLLFKTALAGLAIGNLVGTLREIDVLNASLKTATGSASAASAEFDKLSQFAAETPFALNEVVDSFIKLKNFGLDPSIEALESYGNTAAALGKTLNQFIEAVADAATGEFERLKEFGIKARSEGEKVAFTFRGLTTTVGKNAKEIEAFLKDIGETEFAGAIAERAATLDGALSNLGDSFVVLANRIGQAGLTDVLNRASRALTSFSETASNTILSLRGLNPLESLEAATDPQKIARISFLRNEISRLDEVIESANDNPLQVIFGDPFGKQAENIEKARERLNAFRIEFDALQESRRTTPLLLEAETQAAPIPVAQDPAATKAAENARKAAARAIERQRKAITTLVEGLKQERDLLGATKEETVKYRLEKLGATEATIKQAQAYVREAELGEQVVKAQEDAAKASAEYRKALEEQGKTLEEQLFPQAEYARRLAEIQELLDAGAISETVYTKARDDLVELLNEVNKVEGATGNLDDIARDLGLTFSSAFEDAIVEGKKFNDILDSIAADILRLTTRELVTKPFSAFITEGVKGFQGGGGFGGFDLSGIFGRQFGGPVSANTPFLVGEKGPELFVPKQSGNIVPNNQLGDASKTVIINNQFPSVRDFTQFQRSERQFNAAIVGSLGAA